jgi:uncharacterized protein (TIGR02271 family)
MTDSNRHLLPLEATPRWIEGGWSVHLPVRAERITLARESVVREDVRVTRRRVQEVARVQAVLRRETLRTTAEAV